MAETVDCSNFEKDKTKGSKRQEGDGFAFLHQTSECATGFPLKLNNQMAPVVETEGVYSCLGNIPLKPATARADLSSQRGLRQQFRQLQNQELIKRILKSTGIIPNNSNRSGGKKQSEDTNEAKEEKSLKEKALLGTKNPLESKTLTKNPFESETFELPKKPDVSSVKEEYKEERKQEKVDSNATLKTLSNETKMQAERLFVCSKCDASMDQIPQRPSNVIQSCISFSTPKTEENLEIEKSIEGRFDSDSMNHQNAANIGQNKVDELSESLKKQPNQETLDEILKVLQNQPLMTTGGKENDKEPEVPVEEPQDHSQWRQEQQQKFLMMGCGTRPNLREKHSRQLADVKDFYEGEIGKLRDQLESLRGNLANLQEAIPVKMLEATNHKLDARCNLMEEIASELKSKSQKLEKHNEELEKTCFSLRQENEVLERRCLFLQKSVQDFEEKQSEMQSKNSFLESKVLHLVQANQMNTQNYKQLDDANKNYEKTCKELELSNQKLEACFRKCKEENLKLSSDIRDLQESLQGSRKRTQELENTASFLQSEKSDWALKVDAAQKLAKAAQKRYEEVRLEKTEKENMAKKLEEQIGLLNLSFENATKDKDNHERNAERDRELLKRLLSEYDALAKENQQLKDSYGAWTDKFDNSQDEINSLRGTITKLIQRNNNLEESLKDSLSNSGKTKAIDSFSPSVRKTWESPVPLNADKSISNTSSTSFSSFDSIFNGKGPATSSPIRSDSKTPQSVKFDVLWDKQASTPTRNIPKVLQERKNISSPDKQAGPNSKSPSNLVIKKSDLITRFDVIFEDSNSGQEVKRSRTGRTSHSFGESPTSVFISSSSNDIAESSQNRLVSNATEAALSAVRAGKVTSQAEWENKDAVARGKEGKKKSEERKRLNQTQNEEDENINGQQNVPKLERRFSSLNEEKKRLESTLSRIPVHHVTKRSLEDKAFLEKRLDEVIQDIGSVRMRLRRHHAL